MEGLLLLPIVIFLRLILPLALIIGVLMGIYYSIKYILLHTQWHKPVLIMMGLGLVYWFYATYTA